MGTGSERGGERRTKLFGKVGGRTSLKKASAGRLYEMLPAERGEIAS